VVEKWVKPMSYYLKLFPTLQRLYLVFPVVKLITVPDNPIPGKYFILSSNPVIIDRKEEWKVEKILDSC